MLFKPYYFNHMMALQMTGGGIPEVFLMPNLTDNRGTCWAPFCYTMGQNSSIHVVILDIMMA